MNQHHTIRVTLTLIGPIMTAGGEMSDPGIDAPMARGPCGRFMLPFSLIKGKFLDAVSELRRNEFEVDPEAGDQPRDSAVRLRPASGELQKWLGRPSSDGCFDPERGLLHFSDFHTDNAGKWDRVIERIQIDPESGSVGRRMLLMVQSPFAYGEEVVFEGTVGFISGDEQAERIRSLLELALRWVPAYGAYRSIGFGRTKSVTVKLEPRELEPRELEPRELEPRELEPRELEPRERWTGQPKSLPLELRFDRPLCVVSHKHASNHFDSEEVVSGTVLKGAVARMIQEVTGRADRDVGSAGAVVGSLKDLCDHFSCIRFGEAKPRLASASYSPVEPPYTIARYPLREDGYFDVALDEEPRLIDGAAPAFRADWKGRDTAFVRGEFGWSPIARERRTRTAVNPTTGRAADEQLFSYGLVLPETRNGQKFVWETVIGLEDVPECVRANVIDQLKAVLKHGITGIGKTRSTADVRWLSVRHEPKVGVKSREDGFVVVTLQTECLMTNPATLEKKGDDPLFDAYAQFWAEVSDNTLVLKRFFARQMPHGGFVSRRANPGIYEPFLLTTRGSVFVLSSAGSERAGSLVAEWQEQGLPNAKWLVSRYCRGDEPLWQRCPYIRENGYGEIAVDLKCHTENRIPWGGSPSGVDT